jgi:hypothetical protein
MEKEFSEQFGGKFLIGGDFNGHNHSWGNCKEKNILWKTTHSIVAQSLKQTLCC